MKRVLKIIATSLSVLASDSTGAIDNIEILTNMSASKNKTIDIRCAWIGLDWMCVFSMHGIVPSICIEFDVVVLVCTFADFHRYFNSIIVIWPFFCHRIWYKVRQTVYKRISLLFENWRRVRARVRLYVYVCVCIALIKGIETNELEMIGTQHTQKGAILGTRESSRHSVVLPMSIAKMHTYTSNNILENCQRNTQETFCCIYQSLFRSECFVCPNEIHSKIK